MDLKICILFSFFVTAAVGQSYEDKRCLCVCPSTESVLNHSVQILPRFFINNVPPIQCNCADVVLPRIADEIKGHENEICTRCDCRFQVRNTTVIKVVVILTIWLVALLSGYMGFLICLDPIIKKRRVKKCRQELSPEETQTLLLYEDEYEE